MYKRWKENKGITLISLGILISVLLIVSTTIILGINDRYNSEKLDKLASDLQQLTEKISIYYVENKEYPVISDSSEEIEIEGISITVDKIDLSKMDGLTLNYGKGTGEDCYTINISTGIVYYKKGINGIHSLIQNEPQGGLPVVKITSQPQWQTAIEGTNATFVIEVENTDGISYQWYVSDTYNGSGTPITNATTKTLTIENATAENEKYYYCVISYNEINKKSDVAKLETEVLESVEAGGYTGIENCKYTDVNGDIAIIPAGFTVSNVSTENTIENGLVIYSMDETTAEGVDWNTGKDASGKVIQKNYNQYVWIPVENPRVMYGTLKEQVDGIEGTKFGKLYFRLTKNVSTKRNWPVGGEVAYSKTSNREPAYLTNSSYADDSSYNVDEDGNKIITKDGIVTEFNNMITSVEKYKGFYIGRYELTGTVSTPTVKKGVTPLVRTNWYNFYKACTNLESGNANANDKVRTTMIWGCQWDQAVKVTLNKVPDFLSNAKAYGVYSDSTITNKGATGRMAAAYNIYDMGGNVYDWTLEANETFRRTLRGGMYDFSSTEYPSSHRMYTSAANVSLESGGCRAQLYIEP